MPLDLKYFTLGIDEKVARITINRPRLLNAMNHDAVRELESIVDLISESNGIRLVAVTGAGRAFSTGIDLKDLSSGKIDVAFHEPWERALRGLETMDKIVLCLIHGYALGRTAARSGLRYTSEHSVSSDGVTRNKRGLDPGSRNSPFGAPHRHREGQTDDIIGGHHNRGTGFTNWSG